MYILTIIPSVTIIFLFYFYFLPTNQYLPNQNQEAYLLDILTSQQPLEWLSKDFQYKPNHNGYVKISKGFSSLVLSPNFCGMQSVNFLMERCISQHFPTIFSCLYLPNVIFLFNFAYEYTYLPRGTFPYKIELLGVCSLFNTSSYVPPYRGCRKALINLIVQAFHSIERGF